MKRLFLILLILFITCVPSNEGKVIRVIDGDTVDVEFGSFLFKKIERVRLLGIDAPERWEPLYLEAKKELEKLVLGKTVRLEGDIEERDRYGRLLRHIYVDDIFVNAELIKLGLARAKFYPPNVKYRELFYKLEKEAREKRRGIWR